MHGHVQSQRVVLLGLWAACRACSPMVEGRRRRDLAQRALRAEERRAGRVHRRQRGAFLSELLGMYLQLEQHLTGDVQQVAA